MRSCSVYEDLLRPKLSKCAVTGGKRAFEGEGRGFYLVACRKPALMFGPLVPLIFAVTLTGGRQRW